MTVKNRRVFELRLGKVGLALFITGISLLLFTLFLLGVVVGKHMEAYPERYASGIPDLIREHLFAGAPKPERGLSPAMDQNNNNDQTAGTDAGTSLSETPAVEKEGTSTRMPKGTAEGKPSETSMKHAVPSGSGAIAGKEQTTSGEAAGKASPPVAPGEGKVKKPTLPPRGETGGEGGMQKPPPGETAQQRRGNYEVQVAAYRERRQAEQMVKKFASLGFSFQVVMKDLTGKGRWFRVIAGGFETRETAREAADRMAEKVGGLKCIVRPTDQEVTVTE